MSGPPRRFLRNASVFTPSGRVERAEILLAGGTIEAVLPRGSADELAARDDIATADLTGRTILPGFVDAHFHLSALALKHSRVDLGGAVSAEDVVARLRAFALSRPDDTPVVGVDWDESGWRAATPPTRVQLDSVSATRPVHARRVCGHVGVVNTVLLRALESDARLSRHIDPKSGRVTEAAVFAANRHCAPPPATLARGMEGAIRSLHALGVTAVHDIVTTPTLDAYLDGVRASRAPLGIDAFLVGTIDDLDDLHTRLDADPVAGFRAAGIKLFADGSLGGRTAALHMPYADADTRGDLLLDVESMRATFADCARAGVACAVHAIGDRAVSAVLAARADSGAFVRIEHAEVLGEAEIDAAACAGVALVMQPNFVRNWQGEGGLYQRRLGGDRWKLTNPFRTLESRGATVVFGSDGMPPGPLFGVRGATRHPVAGQSIDAVSALRRYTEASHRALPGPRRAGFVEAGGPADLVVLSGNPVLADTDSLRVEATIIGGEEVFRAVPSRGSRNSVS